MGDSHHAVFFGNQVFNGQVVLGFNDLTATLVAELFNHSFQLFANHSHQAIQVTENILVVGNLFQLDGELFNNFVVLHAGKAVQTQLENIFGLLWGQMVFAVAQTVLLFQPLRAGCLRRRHDPASRPQSLDSNLWHQCLAGICRSWRLLDQWNNFIDIGQRNGKAFQCMGALAGLCAADRWFCA